jgi:uncharacterized protein YbbC (DUF1343 family)
MTIGDIHTACGTAPAGSPSRVITGIDRLVADPSLLAAWRIGLVTNYTGVTAALERGVDRLLRRGVEVAILFGPEHGLRGTAQAGESEGDSVDAATGLTVVDTYEMPDAALDERIRASGVDALVFDMQDIGTRYWTYTSTMFDCMAAAARAGIGFVVLDRPNPIGGTVVEGPGLDPALHSFVGRVDVPLRHGLTSGELARLIAQVAPGKGVPMPQLEVIGVTGWGDRAPSQATGLPWVPPSPNLPTADSALVYPATGLIEGVNVSEGRGTTRPFETIGAPFVDERLLPLLTEQSLPGLIFRETWFRPTFHKYAGETVRGVALHVTDQAAFLPVRTGLTIMWALAELYPGRFRVLERKEDGTAGEPGCALDRLWGSDSLRHAIEQGDPRDLITPPTTPEEHYPTGVLA